MDTTIEIGGEDLTVSEPDKILWTAQAIRKLDYIQYLIKVAPFLLAYTRNRML